MTLRLATPEQVRALVDEVRAKDPSARVIGVRAEPIWSGPSPLAVAGATVSVRTCPSVLAVRAALADHNGTDDLLVVLTDREEHELGLDVTTRLAKRRLLSLDPWTLVRSRLGVTGLDPAFVAEQWLAEALLHHEPAGGWPPVVSGFLDVDTAWRMLRHHWLGLPADRVDLTAIVGWLAAGNGLAPLHAASDTERNHCLSRLDAEAGSPARELVELALDGRADDVVPLGLAARVVFAELAPGDADAARLAEARIHFAYRVGDRQINADAAGRWADAAEAHTARTRGEHGVAAVDAALARAEAVLHEVGAADRAWTSRWLPAGFSQRLARVGELLGRYLDEPTAPTLDAAETAAAEVRRHAAAAERSGAARVETLDAAVRLARRRLTSRGGAADSLATAAQRFAADAAYVDRCRLDLYAGDREPSLSALYTRLLDEHDAEREAENRRFAELLAAWSTLEPTAPEPTDRLLPIEYVLDQVVAPLAATAPVLLVVADGMSQSVASEVVDDLNQAGWVPLAPDGRALPQILATLPTVTEASRASLLSGRRCTGLAPAEKTAFASHPGLRATASAAAPPPALFHKADITTPDGAALATPLRAAIADTARPVVGVVINTIDDHLARGQQLRVRWTSDAIAPLDALLAEAAAAGRVVVMTSDHGHVIDHGSAYRPGNDAAERWRPARTAPSDDELEVAGPRVLLGDGRIIAPWTERLRYGTPKHGYHGGLTPQEVLVPLVVLARADSIPDGWEPARPAAPAWWNAARATEAEPPPLAPTVTTTRPRGAAPTLFDEEPARPPGEPAWIAALLGSEVYASQRAGAGRQALDDDRASALLVALHRRGGTALLDTLAADAGIPSLRIRGTITSLRRVLNVDGYDVVGLADDGTVSLNRSLLAVQFGVEMTT